jgi:2-dehydropantoate 2-reductase
LSNPLHIAIIGTGNIGSTFACQLALAGGHAVTVIARPDSPRLRQLQRDGAIVRDDGTRAPVTVADRLDTATRYDLVIVTVPAQQVDTLISALRDSAATRILFMVNLFDPERLRDAIGFARCDFGMPFLQASLDADGRLHAVIGAGGQKSKLGAQRWADVFNAGGLPAALEPDMLRWLRCHAPLCVAFESVSVAGARRGGGASWREAAIVAHGMQACFALIVSGGDQLHPAGKRRLHASPFWVSAAILWSVSRIPPFRVLLARGENECRALAGAMATAAQQAGRFNDAKKITAMQPPGRGDAQHT